MSCSTGNLLAVYPCTSTCARSARTPEPGQGFHPLLVNQICRVMRSGCSARSADRSVGFACRLLLINPVAKVARMLVPILIVILLPSGCAAAPKGKDRIEG